MIQSLLTCGHVQPYCFHIMHISIQKAVGKFELGSTLTPKSKGPKSDPSRPCERRRCWSSIAGATRNTKRASIIWPRSEFWLTFTFVMYFVMLGLHHRHRHRHHHHYHHHHHHHHHQFAVHCTIGSKMLYNDGMAFWNLDLTLRWGSCRYSLGDMTWRRF